MVVDKAPCTAVNAGPAPELTDVSNHGYTKEDKLMRIISGDHMHDNIMPRKPCDQDQ